MLEEKERELEALVAPAVGCLPWSQAVTHLAQQEEIRTWMRRHWRNLPIADLKAHEIAHLSLLREFVRRPKRQNSLETLGFVALEYPSLEKSAVPPTPWKKRGLPDQEWVNFLKVVLDFTVRGYTAVQVDPRYLRWMGSPVRPKVLTGPEAEMPPQGVVRWPKASRSGRRNRLVELLVRILDVSLDDRQDVADIDACLTAAWDQVRQLLVQTQEGWILRLDEQVVLREVSDAWLCPVTRRVVDTAVCGLTPYVNEHLTRQAAACKRIRMPTLPHAFWRHADGAGFRRDEIEAWIERSEEVRQLEAEGAWTDLNTRIFAQAAYFQVAEHSAQQSPARLAELERDFRAGQLNLLSCSTTMEMGVDIGGLAAVAMNNAPPSPAVARQTG